MSNTIIIRDIIPIVVRIMNKKGANLNSETHLRDENLITFFEEELSRSFSICGSANHCQELEAAIKEYQERDPVGFEEFVKYLLNKYVSLQLTLRKAEKLKEKPTIKQVIEMITSGETQPTGPPDRFSEFRKKKPPFGPGRWVQG